MEIRDEREEPQDRPRRAHRRNAGQRGDPMIALDTLALVYWLSGREDLSETARNTIETELNGGDILISTITLLDVAQFVEDGRLALAMDTRSWLSALVAIEGVRTIPVSTAIAARAASTSSELNSHQRLIAATAYTHGCALVTPEARIGTLAYVETVW
ncbi:type II toxin-antitoxin system VapC family toxin [Paraburkholderia acidipaludis]|uniref:type II toxin-antitoxin system VapC family toxin n=1 Tax=Paraburkholderia acidipaludis TaxID=660537 RepID=UPI001FDEF40F|nr:type II toxin-antitoxin system VapC family toxin [Paraburkholderia acidipaludis]